MDIFKIEARGRFSPPGGGYPQMLPDYWREKPGGIVRTDLPELSIEELNALGWYGPITMPEKIEGTSFYTHNYTWNPDTISFDIEEVEQYEKEKRVNYREFWNMLLNTSAYAKIKEKASISLPINTIVTEFISLLFDAKLGNANIPNIQKSLNDILSNISLTNEELDEVRSAFIFSGMFAVYTLT